MPGLPETEETSKRSWRIPGDFRRFGAWLDAQGDIPRAEWLTLFRDTFRFTGNEITGEFLMSTGYLPGAHPPACPLDSQIEQLRHRLTDPKG